MAWHAPASMAASVFSLLEFCGIHDPFALTLFLRVVTGVFALGTLRSFTRTLHILVRPESNAPLLLLTSFLWFLPLLLYVSMEKLGVRCSSCAA